MTTGRAVASPSRISTHVAPEGVKAWHLYALLALIAAFHVLTLRSGHQWADDFALYVLHARNLVEGRPYADTGYIYNTAIPWHGPRVYPPGFPLLLAPVYAVFGLNLFALRFIVVASLVASVAAFAVMIRPLLTPRLVLVTAALVGFQPFFIGFKNLLLPDFSFTMVVILSLYCLRRLHESRADFKSDLGWAVLAGVLLACSMSFRTAGIALFGGLALYHTLRLSFPSRAILVALTVALLLYSIQYFSLPTGSGYVAQVADAAPVALREPTAVLYLGRFVQLFKFTDIMWRGTTWALTSTLMFVTALLATIGFLLRLRHVSVLETFVVAYVGLLVVFPFSANRYLLPIIPFILMYGMIGLVFIADRGGVAVKAVAIALAVLVGITYVANVVLVDRSPFLTGVTSANARAGFHYLRECTPTDAIILSRRPRAVALFTRRDAMTAGRRQLLDRAAYQSFVQSAGIDYVAAFNNSRMDLATAALPELFTRVFQNNQWVIYRYDPGDGVRGTRSSNACSPT